MAKKKNPFAKTIGSGMAKTPGAVKPGKAKGMPLKVGGGMPTEKVQGGKAVGTAHGATFGKIGAVGGKAIKGTKSVKKSKGKKRPLKG